MKVTCQNAHLDSQYCQKEFTISEDNKTFCDKIGVPYPTWCPLCRMTRRLSFVNAWSVSYRNCDKCGKQTMSAYRTDAPLTVYCQPCWWGDTWDGTEYAMEYNPSRPFLEQWRELQLKTPQCALETTYLNLKNSDYCNSVGFMKNCYLTFWADYCEDVYYSSILNSIKDSSDLLRANKSELCYDSVGLGNCSKTFFSDTCDDCVDVWFSRNCYGCISCIGCVNQRGQSYMIFNQKYSKEGYLEKVSEMRLDTREGIENMRKQAEEFTNKFPYREHTGNTRNFNVSGDYIFESKNALDCYMSVGAEDCRFSQFITVPSAKDCYDYSGWGDTASLMYECASVGQGANNCKLSFHCFPDSLGLEYGMWCIGGKYNFGCANLKRKSYAILNKVYDKETYEKLVSRIKDDMIKNPYVDDLGRVYTYGEFFPPEFSLFPYNDTNAMKFLPKTKEKVLREGYLWQDKVENSYQKTIRGFDLPQTIEETTPDILDEIIECAECARAYKIVEGEYTILKKLKLPLPSSCQRCREAKRFEKINKPIFSHTLCDKCGKDMETAHDRTHKNLIYCAKCYQGEMF